MTGPLTRLTHNNIYYSMTNYASMNSSDQRLSNKQQTIPI